MALAAMPDELPILKPYHRRDEMTNREAKQRARDIVSDENDTEVMNDRPALSREERAKRVESYTRTILKSVSRDVSHFYPNDVWV